MKATDPSIEELTRPLILRVDLTTKQVRAEHPPIDFMRRYMGGALGAYYLYKETQPGFDPLSPENVITFTPGLLAHLPVGAYNRVAVTSKSPLTGAIIDSQAGGFWGPECMAAGVDAVVIQGRAESPVFLLIQDGNAELRDASGLWGLDTGASDAKLRQITGERRLRSFIIGPGGENLVRFANVANNLRHFAGRGGLGAVMGSKHLKAVVVHGGQRVSQPLADRSATMAILKEINQSYADDEFFRLVLTPYGTPWGLRHNQELGRLPTRNFEEGVFEGAGRIDHLAHAQHSMTRPGEGCFACRVQCKRTVEYSTGDRALEKGYGGAEYETLGSLGSLLGIDDIEALEMASQLCARYTLDTISCGATLAWAFDCFAKGLITREDTGGIELRWGDADAMLNLIDLIAYRRGFGDLLAEGSALAARHFGPQAEGLVVAVKGMEWPAVDPRVDLLQAIAYAVSPTGADHMTMAGPDCAPEFEELRPPPRLEGFSHRLLRSCLLQRTAGSMIDGLGLCQFLVGATGLARTIHVIETALGWHTSLWELMRAGERRLAMFRSFNAREGFGIEDDTLPARAFIPVRNGPEDGTRLDPDAHRQAVEDYYAITGWNASTGWPNRGKLMDLGLEWMSDEPAHLPSNDGST